jgi:hypothetical protein
MAEEAVETAACIEKAQGILYNQRVVVCATDAASPTADMIVRNASFAGLGQKPSSCFAIGTCQQIMPN